MLNLQLQILNCCLFAQLLEDIKRVSSQTFWQHQTQNTMMQYVDAIAVLNFVNHCFNLNCVGGLNLERLLLLLIQLHSQLNTGDINRLFSIRSPVIIRLSSQMKRLQTVDVARQLHSHLLLFSLLWNILFSFLGIRPKQTSVLNSQGRNLGRQVTSARTSGLSSTQGMVLGDSG